MKTRKLSYIPSLVGMLVSNISEKARQEIISYLNPQQVQLLRIQNGYWWIKVKLTSTQITYINEILKKNGSRIRTIFTGNAQNDSELRSLQELAKLLQVHCKQTL